MPSWLRLVLGVLIAIAMVGGASYLFHDEVVPVLAIDPQTATITRATDARGKVVIVVTGDIVNGGRGALAATKLHLTFKDAQGKRIGQRAVPLLTGGIPPNGRARFETRIDDTPAQSTKLDLAVE